LDYTLRHPIKRAAEQDPNKVAAWLKVGYRKMVAKAKAENALVIWSDETAASEDGYRFGGALGIAPFGYG
jgi:hypothetical protein